MCKDITLGQRSRSQPALTVRTFEIHVRPITSSCIVGFENDLAEMITVTRQCVTCKNHVPSSKFKVTADSLSSGIPELCPTTLTSFKELVGFENYLAEMIITTRSSSQVALTVYA